MKMNDILGKQTFAQRWSHMLWQAMGATGKGYKLHSLGNTGRGDDRRRDKRDNPSESKLMRGYRNRFKGAVNAKA